MNVQEDKTENNSKGNEIIESPGFHWDPMERKIKAVM